MRFRTPLLSLAAAGLLAFLLAPFVQSCRLISSAFPPSPAPRPFTHLSHAGLDCTMCHEGAETQARAGMPSKDLCMMCHEEIDAAPGRPPEKKVAWFLDAAGAPAWSAFTRQSSEIVFSHQAHAAKQVRCEACHGDMVKSPGLVPAGMFQRMDACVACHRKAAPGRNECRTCHTLLDRHVAPASHYQLWGKRHGICEREGTEVATANDCAMCHGRDACTTCHQTQAPDDHTNFWRLRGHGIAARVDRTRCATCHTSDGCNRCHRETAPMSHSAGWNAPRNRHCTSCHLPLSQSPGCAVCHTAIPGHAAVPPWPAWHSPALNCRSCHAATLRHPDNGDACTHCHR